MGRCLPLLFAVALFGCATARMSFVPEPGPALPAIPRAQVAMIDAYHDGAAGARLPEGVRIAVPGPGQFYTDVVVAPGYPTAAEPHRHVGHLVIEDGAGGSSSA